MVPTAEISFSKALQDFLLKPKSQFYSFFQACRLKAFHRLRSLRAAGWRLPPGNSASQGDLSDLACEVIEPMFVTKEGPPFHLIFDYFAAHQVTDIAACSPDELEHLFLPFFYQQMKQGLSRAMRRSHPELYRLRRRYGDILMEPEYVPVRHLNDGITHFTLSDKLRLDAQTAPEEIVAVLAMESLLATTKDTALCRDFFDRLHAREEYQNFTRRRPLIACLVRTRETFVKQVLPNPAQLATPDEDLKHAEIRAAQHAALKRINTWIEQNWLKPSKVPEPLAQMMCRGCALYLVDYCDGAGTDSKATYFREVAPTELHTDYDRIYKHNFLRLITLAEHYIEEYLTSLPRQTPVLGTKDH